MADFFSVRFGKSVWITKHALESMRRRNVDPALLIQVFENGDVKRRDDMNFWIFKHIQERTDNLICAAVVEQAALVVKTVMVNWELEDEA